MKFVCDGCGKTINADANPGNLTVHAGVASRWTQASRRELHADACSEACARLVLEKFTKNLATDAGKGGP
jgi:hypothetical protein